ncbi:hypothetical protein CVT25_008362 [Psilocybe cyanescens]|uniref:Uncharacterized protein n=1 Tax=Psilocybe cyanescens TaxID=93625 RepID=A0A409WVB9_PSICY|nr:hypothetical protein CVT25_008362 [Psilocybe cyanescens]
MARVKTKTKTTGKMKMKITASFRNSDDIKEYLDNFSDVSSDSDSDLQGEDLSDDEISLREKSRRRIQVLESERKRRVSAP